MLTSILVYFNAPFWGVAVGAALAGAHGWSKPCLESLGHQNCLPQRIRIYGSAYVIHRIDPTAPSWVAQPGFLRSIHTLRGFYSLRHTSFGTTLKHPDQIQAEGTKILYLP